ncbi:MAG: hypothetical protein ACO4AI_08750 [Prochlorothrix sp.]
MQHRTDGFIRPWMLRSLNHARLWTRPGSAKVSCKPVGHQTDQQRTLY